MIIHCNNDNNTKNGNDFVFLISPKVYNVWCNNSKTVYKNLETMKIKFIRSWYTTWWSMCRHLVYEYLMEYKIDWTRQLDNIMSN